VKRGRAIAALVVISLVVVGIAVWMGVTGSRPRLGLDLRGGVSVTLTPVVQPGQSLDSAVLDETIEVIRRRVDSLGVSEPEISRQGNDVLVQLPGLQDRDRALEIIGDTAKLTFRPVTDIVASSEERYASTGPDCASEDVLETLADDEPGILCGQLADDAAPEDLPLKYGVGPAVVTGDAIDEALSRPESAGQGAVTGNWEVQVTFDSEGAVAFAAITGQLACERDQGGAGLLAIVLDRTVHSAPSMDPQVTCGTGIADGTAIITVGGEKQASDDLALVLRTGALPITLEPSTATTVSPTLGAASLRAGLLAGAIGLALVMVWLIYFYRLLGLIAMAGLVVFAALVVGTITLLGRAGFTLTLAGIAGIIVSIGVAADSSIIYFERIKDELATGRTMRTSVQRAFSQSWRTNVTGNTVTFAAAFVLYFLAVGPVRGFAFTLGLATLVDLLVLGVFTRPIVILLGTRGTLTPRRISARRLASAAGDAA